MIHLKKVAKHFYGVKQLHLFMQKLLIFPTTTTTTTTYINIIIIIIIIIIINNNNNNYPECRWSIGSDNNSVWEIYQGNGNNGSVKVSSCDLVLKYPGWEISELFGSWLMADSQWLFQGNKDPMLWTEN